MWSALSPQAPTKPSCCCQRFSSPVRAWLPRWGWKPAPHDRAGIILAVTLITKPEIAASCLLNCQKQQKCKA